MRRIVTSLVLGGLAGALSAFSHGVAGGSVAAGPLLTIIAASGLAFVALPRRLRGLTGIVSLLIAIQFAAHLWLEVADPHQHGAPHVTASGESQAPGLAGAIEHALTPGMLMMWAHLLAVIVGAILILALRPLLETLLGHAATWFTPLVVMGSPVYPAAATAWLQPRNGRPELLAHTIEGRGPPVLT